MKNRVLTLLVLLNLALAPNLFSQNVGINSTGNSPDVSAMLDISSTTKGFLMPRMTTTERDAISFPATGLTLFNTTIVAYQVNTGTGASPVWSTLGTSANGWSTTGNSGTNWATNFLGTTDNTSLRFRTNNTQKMKIDSLGNVAVGTDVFDATFPEKLLINAGVTTSVNAFVAKGSVNNYFQMNIKNTSTAANATSDIVATADNGSETTNYVDLGINGSGYTGSAIETGVANDGYLISAAKDFYLVNSSANKNMLFLTGGTGVANERMRILANGRVGMGVQDPTAPFVVKDTMEVRRVGSLSQLLFTNTAGTGDFRIGGDGGDIFWQGGGGRALQMGSYWTTVLAGDRLTSAYPSFISSLSGAGVLVLGQRDASVPLAIQANSGTQSANLTQWRNSSGTALSVVNKDGFFGIGNSAPTEKLDVTGNVRFSGALMPNNTAGTSGYVLTSAGAGAVPTWNALPAALGSWSLSGNAAINPVINFLGTTDNKSLRFRTNNVQGMTLDSLGNVGIGSSPTFATSNPEKLLVDAGTGTYNVISGKGNLNSYLQLNIKNSNAGTGASSDVVATNDAGTEANQLNFIDMGVNSSGYGSGGVLGGANNAYLYSTGNDLIIGNNTASMPVRFYTTNASAISSEGMRLDPNGNLGIGTINPSSKLHVYGTNPLTLTGVQTGANTDSILTIINGVVKKLAPTAIATSGSAWGLTGNSSTNPSTNFIGTTDNQAFVIKENNSQVGRFDANSLALGTGATTNNSTQSYALGSSANVGFSHTNAYAIGNSALVNTDNSFSIGNSAVTNGSNSFAIGNNAAANNTASVAIGSAAITAYSITDAIAIGTNATANFSNAVAIGSNTTAANKTIANAANSIAIGPTATSNSTNAIAIGNSATVGFSLTNPIAIGKSAVVNGSNGVAIGNGASIGNFSNATVIGAGASATSTAANSSAIGYNASATLPDEIILGDRSNSNLSVGIGSETFTSGNREKLLVDAGTTSYNVISGKGNLNSYLQLNIKNSNTGTGASSDVVATNDAGTEANQLNFIDMGVNSSGYSSSGILGGANNAYLYSTGNDLIIGNNTASKPVRFYSTNSSAVSNEAMRIDPDGNLGMGVTNPLQKLDVTGNFKLTGAFMPAGLAGNAGEFLISSGAGVSPTWYNASTYVGTVAWTRGGNAVAAADKIGTTTNFDFPFITNNTEKMRLSAGGNLGIGATVIDGTNAEKLLVDAGTTSYNVISGKGNLNSYLQLNIKNINTGTGASSDVVATNDAGTEANQLNFIDMGVNSSGYSSGGILGGANNAYLYSTGYDLIIGNNTASKPIRFFTTNGSSVSTEALRIASDGSVGIGTTSPNSTFQAAGSVSLSLTTQTGTTYTATASDYTIVCNNTAAMTVNLPTAVGITGRIYIIKKTSGASLNVTIDGNGTQTIDGALTKVLTTQYEKSVIQSDGANWVIIN